MSCNSKAVLENKAHPKESARLSSTLWEKGRRSYSEHVLYSAIMDIPRRRRDAQVLHRTHIAES